MTVYYRQIGALIDPEQSDPLSDGDRLQDVSVILTDRARLRSATPAGDRAAGRRSTRARVRAARARRARRPREEHPAMTVKTPAPPPLPDELDRLCAGCGCPTSAARHPR